MSVGEVTQYHYPPIDLWEWGQEIRRQNERPIEIRGAVAWGERIDGQTSRLHVGRRSKRNASRITSEYKRHGVTLSRRGQQFVRAAPGPLEARSPGSVSLHAHRVVQDDGHCDRRASRSLEREPRASYERRRAKHGKGYHRRSARDKKSTILQARAATRLRRRRVDEASGRKWLLFGATSA
jgi:hypothetical protein